MNPLPPCPYLPPSRAGLDWRTLHQHRGDHRGSEFYLACLEYGQSLWQRRLAARAILCLDRAMGAELEGRKEILKQWPIPYAAMAWILKRTPTDLLVGNPRVHFQHYADRMNEPRRDQRRWRAWACWAIARKVHPEWPSDPKHRVVEPTTTEIEQNLTRFGFNDEVAQWQQVLSDKSLAASP